MTMTSRLPVCPLCGERCGQFLCPCCASHTREPRKCDLCADHVTPCMTMLSYDSNGICLLLFLLSAVIVITIIVIVVTQ